MEDLKKKYESLKFSLEYLKAEKGRTEKLIEIAEIELKAIEKRLKKEC